MLRFELSFIVCRGEIPLTSILLGPQYSLSLQGRGLG